MIQELIKNAKTSDEFATGYLRYLSECLTALDVDAIVRAVEVLENVRSRAGNIYVAGNGGSAAIAQHIANDLSLCSHVDPSHPYKIACLSDNVSIVTAIANDVGYEEVFVRQLKGRLMEGDAVIVISASGNSENVVRAVRFCESMGAESIGLLGFDGGRLFMLCDVVVLASTSKGEYGPAEDVLAVMGHLFTYLVTFQSQTSGEW